MKPKRAGFAWTSGPLRDAGATWWDERQVQTGPDLDSLPSVMRRIEAGPPVI
ncbi:hypothetical protein GCM10010228_07670 [Streptomyces massasporeus]|nr:hypothetical protein GCM10010228_07670 [Streptomyces massasporeus]